MSDDDPREPAADPPLVTQIAAHASYCLTETFDGDGNVRIEGCELVEITIIDPKKRIGIAHVKVDLPDAP